MTFIVSYNVCLRRESGYCAVEWSTMPSDDKALGQFSVSEDYDAASATPPLDIARDMKIGDSECAEDFVVISQGNLASDSDSAPKDR